MVIARRMALNLSDRAEKLPDGDVRDHFLAEYRRTAAVADDFRRVARQDRAAERDIIRQGCYGQG